jgi:hypothetical protein
MYEEHKESRTFLIRDFVLAIVDHESSREADTGGVEEEYHFLTLC